MTKSTNNDLQTITWDSKAWGTQTTLKTGGELRCFGNCLDILYYEPFIIYHLDSHRQMLFFVLQNDLREVVVCYVDIGEIVVNHCLSILFITECLK